MLAVPHCWNTKSHTRALKRLLLGRSPIRFHPIGFLLFPLGFCPVSLSYYFSYPMQHRKLKWHMLISPVQRYDIHSYPQLLQKDKKTYLCMHLGSLSPQCLSRIACCHLHPWPEVRCSCVQFWPYSWCSVATAEPQVLLAPHLGFCTRRLLKWMGPALLSRTIWQVDEHLSLHSLGRA